MVARLRRLWATTVVHTAPVRSTTHPSTIARLANGSVVVIPCICATCPGSALNTTAPAPSATTPGAVPHSRGLAPLAAEQPCRCRADDHEKSEPVDQLLAEGRDDEPDRLLRPTDIARAGDDADGGHRTDDDGVLAPGEEARP